MSDSLITVIAIALTAVLIFVFPLMTMSDRYDSISKTDVKTVTAELVNVITSTGKITEENYSKFLEQITSTGNTYDIEMEFKILDENPGKKTTLGVSDKIGENVYYSVFTSQIEDTLETDKVYNLKEGDIVSITIKNTSLTMTDKLKDFIYRIIGSDTYTINTTQSGMVITNGEAVI